MAKSDLIVLHEMANNDMDIRSTSTLVEAKTVKQGGIVSFGVDADSIQRIIGSSFGKEQYIAVCYIINSKQFFDLKNKE